MAVKSMNDITRPKSESRPKAVGTKESIKPVEPVTSAPAVPDKKMEEASPTLNSNKPKKLAVGRSAIFLIALVIVVVAIWFMREDILNALSY